MIGDNGAGKVIWVLESLQGWKGVPEGAEK